MMPGRTQSPRVSSGKRMSAAELAIERWHDSNGWIISSNQPSCALIPPAPSASAKCVISVTLRTCRCMRTAL
jgi:hypothetical protein